MSLAQWSQMVAAIEKEKHKGRMTNEKMDELLADARKQYDWIK